MPYLGSNKIECSREHYKKMYKLSRVCLKHYCSKPAGEARIVKMYYMDLDRPLFGAEKMIGTDKHYYRDTITFETFDHVVGDLEKLRNATDLYTERCREMTFISHNQGLLDEHIEECSKFTFGDYVFMALTLSFCAAVLCLVCALIYSIFFD